MKKAIKKFSNEILEESARFSKINLFTILFSLVLLAISPLETMATEQKSAGAEANTKSGLNNSNRSSQVSAKKEESKTPLLSNSDATSKQSKSVEKLAIRLLNTTTVKNAIQKGVKNYLASPTATKPEARLFAQSAIEEMAMLASLYTAMGAFSDPSFVWVYAPPTIGMDTQCLAHDGMEITLTHFTGDYESMRSQAMK